MRAAFAVLASLSASACDPCMPDVSPADCGVVIDGEWFEGCCHVLACLPMPEVAAADCGVSVPGFWQDGICCALEPEPKDEGEGGHGDSAVRDSYHLGSAGDPDSLHAVAWGDCDVSESCSVESAELDYEVCR